MYLQTVLDCFSRYAWGRLYTSKLPLTAVQVMNNDVLPFFDEHRVRVKTVLSDNGREFCGRPDRHPYELFLQLEDIEHRTTKVGRPQPNGFIERFHRTLLDEHLRVKGRTTVEPWRAARPIRSSRPVSPTPGRPPRPARRTLRRRQPRHSSGEGQLSGHYHLCTRSAVMICSGVCRFLPILVVSSSMAIQNLTLFGRRGAGRSPCAPRSPARAASRPAPA